MKDGLWLIFGSVRAWMRFWGVGIMIFGFSGFELRGWVIFSLIENGSETDIFGSLRAHFDTLDNYFRLRHPDPGSSIFQNRDFEVFEIRMEPWGLSVVFPLGLS